MRQHDRDIEPVVTLPSGVRVLRCIVRLVHELQAKGHTVTVDGGGVVIDPATNDDAFFVLDSNLQDVQAVLGSDVRHGTEQ